MAQWLKTRLRDRANWIAGITLVGALYFLVFLSINYDPYTQDKLTALVDHAGEIEDLGKRLGFWARAIAPDLIHTVLTIFVTMLIVTAGIFSVTVAVAVIVPANWLAIV